MKVSICLLVVVLGAFLTRATSAQSPTAGQAGAQLGAGNGQAGGTASENKQTENAQVPPREWSFGGFNQTPWFSGREVQEQLRLNKEQLLRLNESYDQTYTRYENELRALRISNLNETERIARRQQVVRDFSSQFNRSVDSVITDSTLRNRFTQLALQYQGPNAFNDPTIRERLKITAEQQLSLDRLQQEWQQQMQQWNSYPSNGVNNTNWNEFNMRYDRSLSSIINPDQLRTLNELRGERFNFPYSSYFPK